MDLYCKMFIDTVSEYNDFFEVVRNFLDGHKQAVSFIINDWCSLSISRNKEYIPASSDFLYWKFIIDIEPVENISETAYINNIKQLVCSLKQKYKVICACDFEELL